MNKTLRSETLMNQENLIDQEAVIGRKAIMNHPAVTAASRYALALLRTHTHGTVHSVYRKTVNLLLEADPSEGLPPDPGRTPGRSQVPRAGEIPGRIIPGATTADISQAPCMREILVALQAAGSPLSPISLITELSGEQMAALPIRAGMEVSVSAGAGILPAHPGPFPAVSGALDTAAEDSAHLLPDAAPTVSGASDTAAEDSAHLLPDAAPTVSGASDTTAEDSAHLLPDAAPTVSGASDTALMISAGPGCIFSICVSEPADLLLDCALSGEELHSLEKNIRGALSMQKAGSLELLFTAPERAGESLILAAAQKRLDETYRALCQRSCDKAARSLVRMTGLGPGLTPAGDDFLCGVLAGLILCGCRHHPFAEALRREIALHLGDTNKISAAFLTCALENQFSQAINELRLRHTSTRILHIFREIGHSSGTDSLCGVLFMLLLRKIL